MMMMLALRPEIMVPGRVGMAGNAEDRPTGEKLQQRVAIDGILRGIVGIEIRDERNMHGHDDQPILRRLAQHLGDEGKLARRCALHICRLRRVAVRRKCACRFRGCAPHPALRN